jgi:drug/metabolite transporter (DMT)-like permease
MSSLSPSAGPAVFAPYRAALLMVLAVFCFSLLNAGAKALEDTYPTLQIIVFARLLAVPMAIWLAIRAGGLHLLKTRRPVTHIARGLFALCSVATFIYALGHMTISKAISINFAAPLFVAMLAALLLGEKVGPRRWAAIAVGFVGVLIIVRPTDGSMDVASLVAVASAVCYAATVILTRRLALTDHSASLLFYFGLMVSLLPALALPFVWVTPTGDAIWQFAVVAIAGTLAWYLMAEAYRFGDASLIVPLDYTGLIFSVAVDLAIFSVVPSWTTFVGGALIVAANLFILWREAQIAKRASAVPTS